MANPWSQNPLSILDHKDSVLAGKKPKVLQALPARRILVAKRSSRRLLILDKPEELCEGPLLALLKSLNEKKG